MIWIRLFQNDFQGFRGTLEQLQMNQQIIQIHWIDALINSKSSFYRFFKFLHFLNPTCFWKCCKPAEDRTMKIIHILHNPDIREQLESDPESITKQAQLMRDNTAITPALKCKLDNLCSE